MKLEEHNLAAALSTETGGASGQFLINEVRRGPTAVIHMDDGSKIVLTTVGPLMTRGELVDRGVGAFDPANHHVFDQLAPSARELHDLAYA
jgi:hypothetical protein